MRRLAVTQTLVKDQPVTLILKTLIIIIIIIIIIGTLGTQRVDKKKLENLEISGKVQIIHTYSLIKIGQNTKKCP